MKMTLGGALIATLAIACMFAVSAPRLASAKPEYAASTGKPCGTCHQNPAGGGALKPYGEAFRANGYKVPGKK